ncbi:hypothetical protein Tco_0732697 [Tanacetum coccineum]
MESLSIVSPKEGKKGQKKMVGYGKPELSDFFADTEDENDGLNPTLQYEWILTFKTEKQTRISSSWIAKAASISCAFLTFTKAQLIEIAIKNRFVGIFVHLAVIVKVENLPLTLESEEHYFASFVYPLLEETRADLASSIEIMYRASFAEIFHWLKNRIWKRLTTLMSRVDADDRSRLIVTNLDVIGVIEDEETFRKLCDEDSIRLCLILALEIIFMGRLLTCPMDDTLFRLVENLEDWNCFSWGEHIWTHLYNEIKNVIEKHSDEHYFGMKKDRMYVLTYTLSGFVFAFQVNDLVLFEFIPTTVAVVVRDFYKKFYNSLGTDI